MKKTNILFVCTGNVFRSMAAKHCLEKYLKDKKMNSIEVDSAGINVKPEYKAMSFMADYLSSLNIDASEHKPKQIESEHANRADLIVAMGRNHQEFIKENFGCSSRFFNEICYGEKTPVLDVSEEIENWTDNLHISVPYTLEVIKYIHDSMPFFMENYERFL